MDVQMELSKKNDDVPRFPDSEDGDCIFIRDLSAQAQVDVDGFGRPKVQPILISTNIYMKGTTWSAADQDILDDSTVNYGLLSKNLLSAVARSADNSLGGLAGTIELAIEDSVPCFSDVRSYIVDVTLPKATLLGQGVTLCLCRRRNKPADDQELYILHVRDLTIPTLVGINSHEQMSKQNVVINVWVERTPFPDFDVDPGYNQIEQIITKTTEESCFATLEALASCLASRLVRYHLIMTELLESTLRIRIEKPSAISLAAAPGIEIRRHVSSMIPIEQRIKIETGEWEPEPVPFPLLGSLDDWIAADPKRR